MIPASNLKGRTSVAWYWKWRRPSVLVETAEKLERVEIPVYRSTGGPIFKTLLSSACRMDCRYCPLARFCRSPRERWEPRKLVKAFIEAYSRGLVKGLFISSGLYGDPDRVVEDMLSVVEELRRQGYRGFIHVRLMPGTSSSLVREALRLADRVGLNLETISPSAFNEVAPSKGSWSLDLYSKLLYAARVAGNPRRVDTQLVVGMVGESDYEILRLVEVLTSEGVGRIHFSPYTPIPGTPLAERVRRQTPMWRVRLLYEAWTLISSYGYSLREIEPILDDRGFLKPLTGSLKEEIARIHPEWFPVDPETASLKELLRVPGIGPRTARKIIELRNRGVKLTVNVLRKTVGLSRWRKASKYLDLKASSGLQTP